MWQPTFTSTLHSSLSFSGIHSVLVNFALQLILALKLMTCVNRISALLFHTVFTFARLSRFYLLLSCIVGPLFAPCLSFYLLEHVHTYMM
jgi:hypothetical protein